VVSRSIPALSKSLGQTQPITFHPTSAFGPINPNTFAYSTWELGQQALKPPVDGGSGYNIDSERDFGKNVPCVNAKRVNEGRSEHGHDESSRAFPKFCRPRPQEVLWENEIANTVRLIGAIVRPVDFAYTYSGHAYARTVLGVKNSHEDEPLWFGLMFKDQLAEAVAQHLNKNDRVYVSGYLTSTITAGENDKPSIFYKVIVDTLNFVPEISPVFSKQVVVNKNTPSPIVPQPTGKEAGEDAAVYGIFP